MIREIETSLINKLIRHSRIEIVYTRRPFPLQKTNIGGTSLNIDNAISKRKSFYG